MPSWKAEHFGDPLGSVVVDELVRLSEFTLREPADSLAGRVARHMGCTEQRGFRPSGGMTAAVLNRSALVRKLEPELRRRSPGSGRTSRTSRTSATTPHSPHCGAAI